MNVRVLEGQTIWDICLQYYGDLSGMAYILEDNDYDNELAIGEVNLLGKIVKIREDQVVDQSVVDYHSNKILTSD